MQILPIFRTAFRALHSTTSGHRRVKYKLPPFYDPYGPRPSPSEKVLNLAESIAELSWEERNQFSSCLQKKLSLPHIEIASVEQVAASVPQTAAASGTAAKSEEKKTAEKTVFNVKLEKFDAAAKIKVIKEVRAFTDLGLKEAKELVEKTPAILKQGLTKEEANAIIEKIKAAGGVAVMQ